ncbi:tyrosine-type recombinase/integrase [Methylobacterium sp. B4]|uniref:tyrosine-type recombinase/integrase n=1 Tax=Methylobacterium sp. B4 TaxID=1938755 RepID=UPI000D7651A8|nr:phage integrase family protein [Methylobacterium sp. B4]
MEAAGASGVLGEKTFISTPRGTPYSGQSLGNYFRKRCEEAGLAGFSMHGLRKTGVVTFLEAGCSWQEIMAITGHRSIKEIERYGREFLRGSAAASAFDRLLARTSDGNDTDGQVRQAA